MFEQEREIPLWEVLLNFYELSKQHVVEGFEREKNKKQDRVVLCV